MTKNKRNKVTFSAIRGNAATCNAIIQVLFDKGIMTEKEFYVALSKSAQDMADGKCKQATVIEPTKTKKQGDTDN